MTDDLLAFLRERLDEDEKIARASDGGSWSWFRHVVQRESGGDVASTWPDTSGHTAEHIARWDPARVLREVEAKRRILDLHPHVRFAEPPSYWRDIDCGEMREAFPGEERPYVGCESCDWDHQIEVYEPNWWCEHVRALAAVYSDHLGYRQEWAP